MRSDLSPRLLVHRAGEFPLTPPLFWNAITDAIVARALRSGAVRTPNTDATARTKSYEDHHEKVSQALDFAGRHSGGTRLEGIAVAGLSKGRPGLFVRLSLVVADMTERLMTAPEAIAAQRPAPPRSIGLRTAGLPR